MFTKHLGMIEAPQDPAQKPKGVGGVGKHYTNRLTWLRLATVKVDGDIFDFSIRAMMSFQPVKEAGCRNDSSMGSLGQVPAGKRKRWMNEFA